MFDCCGSSFHWAFRITAHLVILLLVGIPVLMFYVAGEPFKRGFFCSDNSLRYPYHESTVPTWALYSYCFALPVGTIIITEYANGKFCQSKRCTSKSWISESYDHIFVFFFGAGCIQLITDIAKYTIGRLRPHFFHVCIPNVDCTDPRMSNAYVEKFVCHGKDAYLLKDMRLSFPSGHSSFSAYSMVFLVMYCSARFVWTRSNWFKHVLQYFAIVLAMYTGLSRVSDYKHHWSDVLAGWTLGIVTAVMIVLFVSKLFPCGRRREVGVDVSRSEGIILEEDVGTTHRKYTVI